MLQDILPNILGSLQAWQQHANDPNPPDIAMPPPLEAHHMPAIDGTELGRARHR
jgi:hypothetical protein